MIKVQEASFSFEETILKKMMAEGSTLSDALLFDMIESGVDPEDIYQATDYLEQMFDGNMIKVEYFMLVLTGHVPDSVLVPLDKASSKQV